MSIAVATYRAWITANSRDMARTAPLLAVYASCRNRGMVTRINWLAQHATVRHSTRWQHHHMCQSHRRTCGVAAPSWATKEAVLMMDPPPAAFIAGMACLQP